MMTGKTLLALALSALLPAGAIAANHDTLVYCSEASPESFNPQIASSGPTFVASSQTLYNRLINFDPVKNTPIPSLATDWTISEDGLTYTFTLRQGVKFNSNKFFTPTRDFNADDVIFSVLRQKDNDHPYHKVSQGNYEYFNDVGLDKLIKSVKKVDDYHVQFVLNEPNAAFLADWGMDFASILSAEYADAMMKKGTPENVDTWPIGTGPYVLQQYKVDSQIRYLANPNYWDGPVPTKHLIFAITPNVETRLAKLQTNECQIIPAPSPVQFEAIKSNHDLTLHAVEALNVGYLAFNTEKKPFDNVLVRQALNYATDKQAIVNAVFMGSGTVAKSPIPPNMMGYKKDLKDYSYDPEKAKALLKQAGLEKGVDATLWSMPVQRPYNPNSRRIAEMIQNDWAKVGVKAKIVTYEWGEYLSGIRKGEHDSALYGWMSDNGDPDNFANTLLGCDSIKTGSNAARWCNKEYDGLVKKALVVSDPAKRAALYGQAQEIYAQQVPWIALANGKTFYATRSNVSGYSVSLMGSDFSKVKIN
ncbi:MULTISPECIES: ABC transporter substrate-binding protein [unclassified Klebsiella]|uniref:ABC transporter substrate-binding protein n=1 Tax=Enterobacteriaceae TaxID=543 RepID=UPI0015DC6F1F|nr:MULTISPECIES: ABC transporter substrate-binding protein [unclassified Klebsiella]HAT3953674.1 ABC transporter substrate-binding protein [Kluyvera ascorbata]BBR59052.1 ABC transporter substrate-binding protein [Klebsiella sp. WP4-W18-ESBL-05]BBS91617.1 ABC transporter substrate-binding protein [Klebsiella sp. WP7-S18-CRE-02]BBS96639.1 ABC transporter substrate-binding protein [Klebsiella sp. WP7-S18-CRE-03]BBT01671.1 ABC transporter substrate-binding protein [Klebsiella sp. WP7-S18-ESBL-04]